MMKNCELFEDQKLKHFVEFLKQVNVAEDPGKLLVDDDDDDESVSKKK